MTLLSEYYVPGLHIEDRSIKVPLDWTGHELLNGVAKDLDALLNL